MADPISTALTSFKLMKDGLTYLRDIDDKWNIAEVRNRAADLLSELADMKFALLESREELAAKEKEIFELKEAMKIHKSLVKYKDAYYSVNENGKPIGDPYCLKCFENHTPISSHLIFYKGKTAYYNGWICPNCKTIYDFHSAKRIENKNEVPD